MMSESNVSRPTLETAPPHVRRYPPWVVETASNPLSLVHKPLRSSALPLDMYKMRSIGLGTHHSGQNSGAKGPRMIPNMCTLQPE